MKQEIVFYHRESNSSTAPPQTSTTRFRRVPRRTNGTIWIPQSSLLGGLLTTKAFLLFSSESPFSKSLYEPYSHSSAFSMSAYLETACSARSLSGSFEQAGSSAHQIDGRHSCIHFGLWSCWWFRRFFLFQFDFEIICQGAWLLPLVKCRLQMQGGPQFERHRSWMFVECQEICLRLVVLCLSKQVVRVVVVYLIQVDKLLQKCAA